MVERSSLRSLLLGSLLLIGLMVFRHPLRDGALTVLRFPFTVLRAGALSLVLLPRLPNLAREHEAMRAELLEARLELSELRDALRQSGRLQALQQHPLAARGRAVSVIGRSTVPTQHTLLINAGVGQGVAPGGTVVDLDGVLGRVIEVQPRSALVELLTDPESRVAAVIERTREAGLLVGRGDGQCDLIYLDADVDVQPGDQVLTAGFGGTFPRGLLLGAVTRVIRDASAGSSRAIVKPSVRLNRADEALYLPPEPAGGNPG